MELMHSAIFTTFPELKDRFTEDQLPKSAAILWKTMADAKSMPLKTFMAAVARKNQLPFAGTFTPDHSVIEKIPQKMLLERQAIPITSTTESPTIALFNPWDEILLDNLRFVLQHKFDYVLASPEEIETTLQKVLSNLNAKADRAYSALVLGNDLENAQEDDVALVKLVKKLMLETIQLRGSDLHIQPFLGGGKVRVRVDGHLRRIALLPAKAYTMVCRYFKAHSGMDPTNDRIPQDGRMELEAEGNTYDLRVSALPTKEGSRIVIRLLEGNRHFSLSGTAFALAEVQALRRLSTNRAGLVLVTGPTGSGKTTTLYSLLAELNTEQRNLITVENPVEYMLPGISQINVNEKAGLTFASTLRSTLRQDPDVILIGEIRDQETADIAFQAALTGHLVFSTLHTNDALSSLIRLLDLNIQPSVIADALTGVIAQRLCRRLCEACRELITTPQSIREEEFQRITKIAPAYRKKGCHHCGFTGFHGRIPIAEILQLSQQLKTAILAGDVANLHHNDKALNTLTSLSSSAARHVISGNISVDEANDVIGNRFWTDLAEEYQTSINERVFLQPAQEDQALRPAVMLLSVDPELTATVTQMFRNYPFELITVTSSQQAKQEFLTRDTIFYVFVDVDETMSDEDIIQWTHNVRIDMAWTRLPALILLSAERYYLGERLRHAGATSPFMEKPVNAENLLAALNGALTKSQFSD